MEDIILYVLYIYHPETPLYFDQADVLQSDQNLMLDEIMDEICFKNSCTSDEIELVNIFKTKEKLNQYLADNDLKYLTR